MQHYYFARYRTDAWHLENVFSLVYFFVVVFLRGLLCHYIMLAKTRALHQGQCTPTLADLLMEEFGFISGSPLKLEQEVLRSL